MTDLTVAAARDLLPEWRLALTAERKSPTTIAVYLDSVARYLTWAETQDLPPMRRTSLQTWDHQHPRGRPRARHRPPPAAGRPPLRRLAGRRRPPTPRHSRA